MGSAALRAAAAAGLGRPAIETLEARQMLSVSMEDGFTVVRPGGDSRVIYVSSSQGNDSNSGSSSSSPVRSLDKGISMLRGGKGDQLLLRRGDSWDDNLGFWTKGGRSSSEPLVIGAYGSGARPRLDTGSKSAFMIGSKSSVSNIAIIGIHLNSEGQSSSQPTDGIQVLGRTDNLLIEDVEIDGYRNNIVLQKAIGSVSNVKIRRSVITDAYSSSHSHSQGLYAEGVQGLLLEENVFDHNGWRSSGSATMFNHNAYVTSTTSGLVARGNVFANASSHGLQARPGGTVENNAFIDNAVGLTYGLVNGSPVTPGGVTGRVTGNVFVGAKDIGGNAQSLGMEIGNIKRGSGATVSNNVLINGPTHAVNPAIMIGYGAYVTNPGSEVGVNDLRLENNVVSGWGRAIALEAGLGSGGARSLTNLTVRNNDFQNIYTYNVLQHNNSYNGSEEDWSGNTYHNRSTSRFPVTIGSNYTGYSLDEWRRKAEPNASGSKVNFPNPRDVDDYAGSESAFLSRARDQSAQSWSSKYTGAALASFIRAGYLGGSSTAPPIDEPSQPSHAGGSGGSGSSGEPSLDGLTLINGQSNREIGDLSDGDVIDIRQTPYLNVRADPDSGVNSVKFTLDGKTFSTDNDSIYAMRPYKNGDYYSWTPTVGTHTLIATPYSGDNAGGQSGDPVSVTFTVVSGGGSSSNGSSSGGSSSGASSSAGTVSSLTLVNGSSNKDIGTLDNGDVIDLNKTKYLSVRANTSGNPGSVKFALDGKTFTIDDSSIFAMTKISGSDYYSWTPSVGSHTLTVTPYSSDGAKGSAGVAKTVDFTVVKGGSSGVAGVSASSSDPAVSINDISRSEGDSGSRSFTWTVRLSDDSNKTVKVRWETKGESAVVGSDYQGENGVLTFRPGETTKTVSIGVKGDRNRESNETFVVNLLGAENARIADSQGRATIVNDD